MSSCSPTVGVITARCLETLEPSVTQCVGSKVAEEGFPLSRHSRDRQEKRLQCKVDPQTPSMPNLGRVKANKWLSIFSSRQETCGKFDTKGG